MVFSYVIASGKPRNLTLVQFPVGMVLNIFSAGTWFGETGLFDEPFQMVAFSGTPFLIHEVMAQYKKYSLLIIDEWLLSPLKDTESRDLLEIIEARYKKASTIFCSQFDVPGWREKLGDPILADAICDRIVHDSYTIVIDCKDSMRKRKRISEN